AEQAQEDPDRGGLPGAVRPEEAVYLAGADGQVETVQRVGPAEGLVEAGHRYGVLHASEGTLRSQTSEGCEVRCGGYPTGPGPRRGVPVRRAVRPGLRG